jgi:hypothetical protein
LQGGIGLDGDGDPLPGGGNGRTREGLEGIEGTGCGTGSRCCGEQFASERANEMDDAWSGRQDRLAQSGAIALSGTASTTRRPLPAASCGVE